MLVSDLYNSPPISISREDVLKLNSVLNGEYGVDGTRLPEIKTRNTLVNVSLAISSLIAMRHIYDYFEETVLVSELDQALWLISPSYTQDAYLKMLLKSHSVPPKLDVYNSTEYLGTPMYFYSTRLYKLLGDTAYTGLNNSRKRINHLVRTALSFSYTPFKAIKRAHEYTGKDLLTINRYLSTLVDSLYITPPNSGERTEALKVCKSIIQMVGSDVSVYSNILRRCEKGDAIFSIMQGKKRRIDKELPPSKGILLKCECGVTDTALPLRCNITSDRNTVIVVYKCLHCGRTHNQYVPTR